MTKRKLPNTTFLLQQQRISAAHSSKPLSTLSTATKLFGAFTPPLLPEQSALPSQGLRNPTLFEQTRRGEKENSLPFHISGVHQGRRIGEKYKLGTIPPFASCLPWRDVIGCCRWLADRAGLGKSVALESEPKPGLIALAHKWNRRPRLPRPLRSPCYMYVSQYMCASS